ncbi:hypothetical protein VaNZ11_009406 [Volvox africanus]|uniref:Uncharacterized protein n=1 Tax=Volvox africanus TaxID=51714 RepID=A0ABQ5S797_9CHLO|nr:hypothetical protein VaNZ11_009406 [Volvox africanus]
MRTSTLRLSAAAARSPHVAVSVSDWTGNSVTAAMLANAASASPPGSWSTKPTTTQTQTAATSFISPLSSPTSPPLTSTRPSSVAFFGSAAFGIPNLAARAATADTAAMPRVSVATQLRLHYGSWHWRVFSSTGAGSGDAALRGIQEAVARVIQPSPSSPLTSSRTAPAGGRPRAIWVAAHDLPGILICP